MTIQRHQYILLAIFIFYLIMSILTPLIHDDLQWGSAYGIEMLKEGFQSLNGRYLGNTLEIIAVRIPLFRYLTYSICAVLMILMIFQYITDMKHRQSERSFMYITIFMFVLFIPTAIYSQTYGWFAGFYNYVPATLCSFFILRCSLKIFEGWHLKPSESIALIIVSLIGQWFMENMTLFNVMISFLLVVGVIYKYKRLPSIVLAMSFSTVIGALIMFMSPNYLNIIAGKSNYQKVSDEQHGIITKVIGTLFSQFPDKIIFQSIVILTVMALLMIMLIKRSHLTQLNKSILIIGLLSAPLYTVLIRIPFHFEQSNEAWSVAVTNMIVAVIFFLSLNFAIIKGLPSGRVKRYCIILLWMIPLMTAPLLIVQPIGPRNFYSIYMIYVIITMALISQMNLRPYKIVLAITAVMALSLIIIFSTISIAQFKRINALETAIQQNPQLTEYTVSRLPFESYMQHSSPYDEKKTTIFKTYWGVPEHVKLDFK